MEPSKRFQRLAQYSGTPMTASLAAISNTKMARSV
jgi:hypothetical protein